MVFLDWSVSGGVDAIAPPTEAPPPPPPDDEDDDSDSYEGGHLLLDTKLPSVSTTRDGSADAGNVDGVCAVGATSDAKEQSDSASCDQTTSASGTILANHQKRVSEDYVIDGNIYEAINTTSTIPTVNKVVLSTTSPTPSDSPSIVHSEVCYIVSIDNISVAL